MNIGIHISQFSIIKKAIIVFTLMVSIFYALGYLISIPLDTVTQSELITEEQPTTSDNYNYSLLSNANTYDISCVETNIIDFLWSYNILANTTYTSSVQRANYITSLLIESQFNSFYSKYDDPFLIV